MFPQSCDHGEARVTLLAWLAHYAEDESLQQFVIAQSSDWAIIMFLGVWLAG